MNRPSRALRGRSIPPSRPKRRRWRSRPRLHACLSGVRSAIDFPAAPAGPRFSSPIILPGPSRSYRPEILGRRRIYRPYRSHRPRSMDGRSTYLSPPTCCAVSGHFSTWARAPMQPIATGGRGEHSNRAHRSPPVTAAAGRPAAVVPQPPPQGVYCGGGLLRNVPCVASRQHPRPIRPQQKSP